MIATSFPVPAPPATCDTTHGSSVSAASGYSIWICFRGLAYSQEIAISRESREAVIQDFYFGTPWKDPIRIPNPRVFYPYNGSTLAEVILIHGERETLEHRSLFTLDRKDVGLVSVLQSGA